MIKRLFRKDGIIIVNEKSDDIRYYYFYINNYNKIKLKDMKIEYHKSLSFTY